MKKILILCFALLLAAKLFAGVQAVYYVDPIKGNDLNSGSSASQAFKSIERARNAVRLINQSMTGDIVVYLMDGTFVIDQSIEFDPNDSGSNGHQVIYQAYSGSKPILSGGQKVSGWTLHDAKSNIYQATVSGSPDFRQLFVNGKRAVRARIPNKYSTTSPAYMYQAKSSLPFVVDTAEIRNWPDLNHIECVWLSHWMEKRARISSYTVSGARATIQFMAPECNSKVMAHYPSDDVAGYSTFYYYENSYSFLDAEGEWYFDMNSSTLFYKPRKDEDLSVAEVIVPKAENLINLTGTASNYVHDIQFHGMTFEYSNWNKPNSKGYLNWQAGLQLISDDSTVIPAMVQLDYTKSIRFERNIFKNSSAHGLVTVHKTLATKIIGNVFSDMAAGGIYINSALGNAESAYDTIQNNLVEYCGQVYTDAVGILATNVKNISIEHNLVRNCPYTGISLGYDWTDNDLGSHKNLIRFNEIHDVMKFHDDGAAIYTLGRMDSTIISNNYVYNIERSIYASAYPMAGIYLDNGSCYKTIENNVCDRTIDAFYCKNAPIHDNLFQNNFYNTPLGTIDPKNTLKNNTYITNSNWPAEAKDIIGNAGIEDKYKDIITPVSQLD